jgi:hypothetical protein
MASPKDGNLGTPASPTDPKEAADADDAQAGQVTTDQGPQGQIDKAKTDSVKAKPFKPPPPGTTEEGKEKVWIAIKLRDNEGKPVPGEAYRITLPDQTVAEGTLDSEGCARVEGIDPGQCDVTFPNRDRSGWKAEG